MVFLSFSSLKYFFFGYSGLLEDEKTTFVSQLEVLTKTRYVVVSVFKLNFFSFVEHSTRRKSCVYWSTPGIKQKSLR